MAGKPSSPPPELDPAAQAWLDEPSGRSQPVFRPDEDEERDVSPKRMQVSPEFLSGTTRGGDKKMPAQGTYVPPVEDEEEPNVTNPSSKEPPKYLHQASKLEIGHATVVDTDGSAVNRITYEFLRRREGHEALKGDEEYQDIMKRIADQEKKTQEAKDSASPGDDLTKMGIQSSSERKALEEERRQYLEEYFKTNKVELTDEEKKKLHQHLNESLDKEYPAKLAPTKAANGADVFKNSTGEFHTKTRDDGKYELSTEGTKFSGVVRVPRVDAKGNEMSSCDIIEYQDGKAVSVVAGHGGQTNIHDFDKLLENTKGKGVSVSSVGQTAPSVAAAPARERPTIGPQSAPPGRSAAARDNRVSQQSPLTSVAWGSVPVGRVVRAVTSHPEVVTGPQGPHSPSATPGKGPVTQKETGKGGRV